MLASLITTTSRRSGPSTPSATRTKPPADTVQTLDTAERVARKAFVEYRPADFAEVRAKAAYTLQAGETLTPEDRGKRPAVVPLVSAT